MTLKIHLKLVLITSLFFSSIVNAQDKNEEKQDNLKIPYSSKPSFLSFGFDMYQFTKNLLANENLSFKKNNKDYDLDFRGIFSIDFNKILLDINGGYLSAKKNNENQEKSLFFKINALWNILKKNSNHDIFFIGAGINVSLTRMRTYKNSQGILKKNEINENFCWGWSNISIGVRKTFLKYFFGGFSYTFNFFKIEIYKAKEKKIQQERIYGWGNEESSKNSYLSIYIGIIIPLGTEDERVKDDEYYFNLET